jgi:cytochrome P450
MDMVTVGATAFIMLVAGYDTTGQTLAFVGYILATHPDIQDKVQDGIDRAYEMNGGKSPSILLDCE